MRLFHNVISDAISDLEAGNTQCGNRFDGVAHGHVT